MDTEILDRARGTLLGLATGDVLGVPYEFESAPFTGTPELLGGGLGNYEPGEWSDDTQMTLCIAQVAATTRLTSQAGLDEIAEKFIAWAKDGATDIGIQTSRVLGDAARMEGPASIRVRTAAEDYYRQHPNRSAGNGGLMRTAPVALAFLDDREQCANAAAAVASLTHADPIVGDTCVLWTEAIRHAITTGELDPYAGLDLLKDDVAEELEAALRAAEEPGFRPTSNGYTVTAMQCAWHAIHATRQAEDPVMAGLTAAVAMGSDTDTIAAIAGGLLGAYHGERSIPVFPIHGWPGMSAVDVANLAEQIIAPR